MTNPSTSRAFLWLPNMVTVVRMLTGLLLFAVMFYDRHITALRMACFMAIALSDWIDGWLARKINARTEWGQLMDPLADKAVLLGAFGYFCFTGNISIWFTVLYFIRELLQTVMRISFFTSHAKTQAPTLYVSKLKTALSYGYGILLFAEQLPGLLNAEPLVHLCIEAIIIILSYTGFIKPLLKR